MFERKVAKTHYTEYLKPEVLPQLKTRKEKAWSTQQGSFRQRQKVEAVSLDLNVVDGVPRFASCRRI